MRARQVVQEAREEIMAGLYYCFCPPPPPDIIIIVIITFCPRSQSSNNATGERAVKEKIAGSSAPQPFPAPLPDPKIILGDVSRPQVVGPQALSLHCFSTLRLPKDVLGDLRGQVSCGPKLMSFSKFEIVEEKRQNRARPAPDCA